MICVNKAQRRNNFHEEKLKTETTSYKDMSHGSITLGMGWSLLVIIYT